MHVKILRHDCDRVILQLIDGNITGDPDWEDIRTGMHYNNVVSCYNTCAFQFITNNVIEEVYLENARLVQNPSVPANCIQCQAISQQPPQTEIDMDNVVFAPCAEKN